ncbi:MULTISPECIES: PQQ-like beta-propeller repeat protein [unclassified Sphingomonas]|jgi:outer membrane protein assembly factor BamB|uniref:outer membrane protein assembly factor BamB family protein n=1 Tax=unclassified Sphingomonas TaxID=196159 RepID=UPI0006224D59|nr:MULTISPECIES: PQQ-like beta-propeller repeat protein [unclassified Sphingomonas]KKI19917.1 pyrrolo-quinoline quinone [Sphingomonas sp. Ag1]MDF2604127.1 pyrrolo-quinoline quinone [Sphingomonas sp.]
MKRSIAAPIALAALMGLSACGVFKGSPKKTPTVGNRVPILVAESAAEVDPSLAGVQVLLPPAVVNTEWAQPGGNAAKSMGQLALGASPARVWTASINGGSNRQRLGAAPVIAEGRVFVVDVEANVHAFSAETGASQWTTALSDGDANKAALFGGGASFDGGRVYATDGLGDVVALNATDGAVVWRSKPGGPLRGAPTVANGQVYVLSQDNQLFALDQNDGKVVWTATASVETQGVFGVAAPAAASGTIVAGFSSGELNAYRYENGRTLWQDALSRTSSSTSVSSLADIDAEPVIADGRVYAVGQGGRMVAVEIATGQRLWEQNFASITTPWLAGEWLFIVTDDARLVCLSRANGKVRWINQLQAYRNVEKRKGPYTWFGPVLAGDRLWLTNSRGQLVGTSPADGSVQVTIDNGAPFTLSPVVANQTMYVLDQKGRLSAYR